MALRVWYGINYWALSLIWAGSSSFCLFFEELGGVLDILKTCFAGEACRILEKRKTKLTTSVVRHELSNIMTVNSTTNNKNPILIIPRSLNVNVCLCVLFMMVVVDDDLEEPFCIFLFTPW